MIGTPSCVSPSPITLTNVILEAVTGPDWAANEGGPRRLLPYGGQRAEIGWLLENDRPIPSTPNKALHSQRLATDTIRQIPFRHEQGSRDMIVHITQRPCLQKGRATGSGRGRFSLGGPGTLYNFIVLLVWSCAPYIDSYPWTRPNPNRGCCIETHSIPVFEANN